MKNIICLFSFILSTCLVSAQAPTNWIHLSKDQGYNGVSTDKAYTLVKNRPAQTVVVAIIDSGVDVEHEDLKDNVWINEDEIPGNNLDDDNNGYVDDIHGWNFIGGPKGNVNHDTYEVTRLYKKMMYKFKDANESQLSKEQKAEYELYKKYEAEVQDKRGTAKNRLNRINESERTVLSAVKALENALAGKDINLENLDSLDVSSDPNLMIGVNMVRDALMGGQQIPTIENLRTDILDQFKEAKKHYQNQYDFSYNPDFDPRPLVGDDYNNSNEREYGNNKVEGPDARHGTHVAGIVGAVRSNKIGMDGIATNVRIMSIRTVPNGDERDKDVANAIRYAVDNGASIINMSFGKGQSWDKKVVDEAVRYASKNDVLLVHAAGNSSQDNDSTENYPNDTYAKKKIFRSKQAKNWIEVGALSYNTGEQLVAPFSNYGSNDVDIFAPGMAVYSTVPNDLYEPLQGTSMAAPVVAGVAALLRSYYPSLTAQQIKSILMESSIKFDDKVNVPGQSGGMLVPFSELSVSGGTVDAYKAIQLAQQTKGKKKRSKKKSTIVSRA